MSFQIANKLEVNLLNSNTKPEYVSEFVLKNRIPAIVAAPEYIAPLVAHRAVRNGPYKIICAVDFPSGSNFGMDKIFRTNPDFVGADGFDFLLSSNRTDVELHNEMMAIYNFIKGNRPFSQIRWVLKLRTHKDAGLSALKHMAKAPPAFVRLNSELEVPKIGVTKHREYIKLARKQVPYPIKVCGNVDLNLIDKLANEVNVKRFDVSLNQAEAIIRELSNKTAAPRTTPTSPQPQGPAVKKVGNVGRIRL
jgi:deoxyribose-phosphate aldolase